MSVQCPKCGEAVYGERTNDLCKNCIRIPWACERCDKVFEGYYLTRTNICWDCDRDERENNGKRCFNCEKFSSTDLCWDCNPQNNILENPQNNILKNPQNNVPLGGPILYQIKVKIYGGFGKDLLKKHLSENLIAFSEYEDSIVFETEDSLICEWLRNKKYDFSTDVIEKKSTISEVEKPCTYKITVPTDKLTIFNVDLIKDRCMIYGLKFQKEVNALIIYSTKTDICEWLNNTKCEYSIEIQEEQQEEPLSLVISQRYPSLITIKFPQNSQSMITAIKNYLLIKKIKYSENKGVILQNGNFGGMIKFETDLFEVHDWLTMRGIEYTTQALKDYTTQALKKDETPESTPTTFVVQIHDMLVQKYLKLKKYCDNELSIAKGCEMTSATFRFETSTPKKVAKWLDEHDFKYMSYKRG